MQSQTDPICRIGLPVQWGTSYVLAIEILYCKGESSQTSVYMTGTRRQLINRTLKDCEEALTPLGFCRIHKSYLINLTHVTGYHRLSSRAVELSDGTRLEVSATYKDELRQRLVNL